MLLREIGVPFELIFVDRTQQAHKSPEYLLLNPNGLIPVLVDGDLVLYETAAICLHLCDSFPQAGLAPLVGTPERAHFYKWLVWLSSTLQTTLIPYFYPERLLDPGNAEGAAQVKMHGQTRVHGLLAQIDAQLASHGQPWLLGGAYSAVDPYAFMLCRWTRGFAERPAREYVHIGPWMHRVAARPSVQEAVAAEKLPSPLF